MLPLFFNRKNCTGNSRFCSGLLSIRVSLAKLSVVLFAAVIILIIAKQQPSFSMTTTTSSTRNTTTSLKNTYSVSRHHAVVCFGDSLTAGTSPGNSIMYCEYPYAPHLEKALRQELPTKNNVTISHLGLPGWTTNDMLDQMPGGLKFAIDEATTSTTSIEDHHQHQVPPSLVIILAGTNDLGGGLVATLGQHGINSREEDMAVAARQISDNIIALHRACYEMHVPRTLALAIPPSAFQHYNAHAAALASKINENLQDYCNGQEPRASFVPFPFHYTRDGGNWNDDGLHFSPRGYQVLGESLAPMVASILNELDQETATTTTEAGSH